eukprot:315188-Prorocentrum_minimum.AAC.1
MLSNNNIKKKTKTVESTKVKRRTCVRPLVPKRGRTPGSLRVAPGASFRAFWHIRHSASHMLMSTRESSSTAGWCLRSTPKTRLALPAEGADSRTARRAYIIRFFVRAFVCSFIRRLQRSRCGWNARSGAVRRMRLEATATELGGPGGTHPCGGALRGLAGERGEPPH